MSSIRTFGELRLALGGPSPPGQSSAEAVVRDLFALAEADTLDFVLALREAPEGQVGRISLVRPRGMFDAAAPPAPPPITYDSALHEPLVGALRGLARYRSAGSPVPRFPDPESSPARLFLLTERAGELGPVSRATGLDRNAQTWLRPLASANLAEAEALRLESLLRDPSRLFGCRAVVFSGPRRSGRTTTLYAALGCFDDFGTHLISAEDTIAAGVPWVSQVEVPVSGAGLADIVRAALRQDPDVIVADEPRTDGELDLIHRAAQTGHAVLFTLEGVDPEAVLQRLATSADLPPGALQGMLIAHHSPGSASAPASVRVYEVEASGQLRRW